MDDNELIGELRQLATERTPDLYIDATDVITAARRNTLRRRVTVTAMAVTVAAVGALTVARTTGHLVETAGRPVLTITPPNESEHLARQFAQAHFLPPGMRITQQPVFTHSSPGTSVYYTADVVVEDAQGSGAMRIIVFQPFKDSYSGSDPLCTPAADELSCLRRTWSDGTKATVMTSVGVTPNVKITGMFAIRSDGTWIDVMATNTKDPNERGAVTRPGSPLSPEQMFAFATVFDYY